MRARVGVLALIVVVAGCSGAPDAESAAPASEAEPSAAETTPTAAAESAAAELTAIEVNPSSDGAADVVLRVDGPLSWTSFDDAAGVVVTLRGVVPRGDIAAPEPASGPVRAVTVDVEHEGGSPLSRVTIATRGEVESTLEDVGGALTVRLRPVEAVAASTSVAAQPESESESESEPVTKDVAVEVDEADAAVEVAEASAPLAMPLGTPEEPVRGPEPRGILGSWLQSVAVETDASGTEVILHGDGQFRYSSFGLEDPNRVVVDLEGVAAVEPWSSIPAGDGPVERVRAAQHRVDPEPVTRIVANLTSAVAPVIEPLPTGLRLFFPRQQTRQEAVAAVEAEAASMEPEAISPPEPAADDPVVTAPISDAPLVVEAPGADETRLSDEAPTAGQDASGSGFESQTIAQATREYHGEVINVTITDADLKDTLRDFAQLSGLNIVVHPDVSGSVTVNLQGVPWDQALEQILKMNDLAYEVEGNIMRVAPRAQFREEAQAAQEELQLEALSTPLQTVIKRVSYGTASEVAAVLRGETGASVLSERGSVVVDDRTNTMIIRELPRYMDTVMSIIEHLDAPEPQVHIEARIVETNKDFSRSLGIQWGFAGVADAAHGNTTGLEFPNNISGDGGVNLIRGNDNGVLNLFMGNVLNTFTLDATLQAAENEGLANILSTPSVTVLNNEEAEIQSGVSVPIQTVANNTVSVQFVNATLRLQVTPHVTADGTVLLDINIQKRQPRPDLLVQNSVNLPIATREARTRVIVQDGGTTVIGGIYEVETNEAEDRVPGLANIPLLGHLFRNKSRQESNDELLIFITPRVLKL